MACTGLKEPARILDSSGCIGDRWPSTCRVIRQQPLLLHLVYEAPGSHQLSIARLLGQLPEASDHSAVFGRCLYPSTWTKMARAAWYIA